MRTRTNVEQPLDCKGLTGPLKSPDGNEVYYGQVRGEMKHGWGKQIIDNSVFYQGFFVNDRPEGWGLQVHAGGECFIGSWKKGDLNGHAEYHHKNGCYYKGAWKDHKQEGYGEEEVYDDPNETKYIGNLIFFLKNF